MALQSSHDLAVTMMNEQLTHALAALIDVGRTQIYDVMLNIREALLEEGKTLILLVEDFALLRGVETQLLDAMIHEADPGGVRTLCPMRSALAVTSGYFEGRDTALTRIDFRGGYVYSLDADLGEGDSQVDQDYVRDFIATYLNAARVGRGTLESSFEARSDVSERTRDWVDNACETCRYHAPCHAAFGSADGYGLYPFNSAALDRIVSSQMSQFDPRHILKILDTTLREQRDSLVSGQFPDPSWAAEYDQQQVPGQEELAHLPASVATTYEELDPVDAERRKTLITFWGGVPQVAVNLSATIHEAFDLVELPTLPRVDAAEHDLEGEAQVATPAAERDVRRTPTEPTVDDLDDKALDLWGRGRVLEQKLANEVRKALATAVRGAREWSALGIDPKIVDQTLVNQAFMLPNAKGGGSAATRVIAEVEPSDANAFLLQGVLAADRRGDWSFDRGVTRLLEFSELVDQWADEALRRMQEAKAPAAVVQLLLITCVLVGTAKPDEKATDLLLKLFGALPHRFEESAWGAFQERLVAGQSGAANREDLLEIVTAGRRLRRSLEAKQAIGSRQRTAHCRNF